MATLTKEQLTAKITRWALIMPEKLKERLTRACIEIVKEVQKEHLSGPKMERGKGSATNATLAVRTGRLRKSIHYRVKVGGGIGNLKKAGASAEVGTNVKYGRIHEYGGMIPNAFGRGMHRMVFMPERAYLRPSIAKMMPRTFELLTRAAVEDSYGK